MGCVRYLKKPHTHFPADVTRNRECERKSNVVGLETVAISVVAIFSLKIWIRLQNGAAMIKWLAIKKATIYLLRDYNMKSILNIYYLCASNGQCWLVLPCYMIQSNRNCLITSLKQLYQAILHLSYFSN